MKKKIKTKEFDMELDKKERDEFSKRIIEK